MYYNLRTVEHNRMVFLMLFLTLSCRIVIQMMPNMGFPIISTILSVASTLCVLYCFVKTLISKGIVADKIQFILFLIYSSILTYELYYSKIIPLDDCSGVDEMSSYLRSTITIAILSLLAYPISMHVNFVRFAKLTTILILIFTSIYSYRIGFMWYTFAYDLSKADASLYLPSGFIGGLVMSGFVGLMLCCNLYLYNKWSSNKFLNYILFSIILVIGLVQQAMLVERGPLLFFIMTMIIVFASKGVLASKYAFGLIGVLLILVLFSDELISLMQNLFPAISEKFTDTTGSGRYGEGSITNAAIKQINEYPILGYHCRITQSSCLGVYPHNIILELIMTVGLFITIPFLYLLYKASVQSYKLIKYGKPESLIAIIFIFRLLRLMTSGTIVTNIQFWFSFSFVLATIKYIDFSNQNK